RQGANQQLRPFDVFGSPPKDPGGGHDRDSTTFQPGVDGPGSATSTSGGPKINPLPPPVPQNYYDPTSAPPITAPTAPPSDVVVVPTPGGLAAPTPSTVPGHGNMPASSSTLVAPTTSSTPRTSNTPALPSASSSGDEGTNPSELLPSVPAGGVEGHDGLGSSTVSSEVTTSTSSQVVQQPTSTPDSGAAVVAPGGTTTFAAEPSASGSAQGHVVAEVPSTHRAETQSSAAVSQQGTTTLDPTHDRSAHQPSSSEGVTRTQPPADGANAD
ncbi:unnamed protein product, partial [Amoebophrya sp. A120]